jgi:hypothetical protein
MAKSRRKGGEGDEGAPPTAGEPTASNRGRDRIAIRAYELYLARGAADGQDMEDWLAAERELSNRSHPDDDKG